MENYAQHSTEKPQKLIAKNSLVYRRCNGHIKPVKRQISKMGWGRVVKEI